MTPKLCQVLVQGDHIAKVSSASPDKALAELIWNSLDADATKIEVFFKEEAFGTNEIVVRDNGSGFLYEEAETMFGKLGGSWKSFKEKSPKGRFLHGKEGQGRFKAFALGRCVEWEVKSNHPFKLSAVADHLERFSLEPLHKQDEDSFSTSVTITELHREFHILNAETAIDKLLPIFSLYLRSYPEVSITIGGIILNPSDAIQETTNISLGDAEYKGNSYSVDLEIIEWKANGEKELWYCTKIGFPLEKYHRNIRGVGDFGFSAYLKSELVSILNTEGSLGLGDLNTNLGEISEKAIRFIKEHFTQRALVLGQAQIRKWKSEDVYPYKNEAKSPIEMAERQVFDIVAVRLAESMPALDQSDKKSKSFQLRMLKHAVENNPEDLQTVITEVLNLPKGKLEELSGLLQDVSLASMISASKMVSDRLKFLSGLEFILFDQDSKKTLKERSQLHRIIAKNSWIFGQEFSVSVDDQSLTEVLRKHRKILNDDTCIDEPVTRVDGTRGIVDLMLSRSIPCNRDDEIEHLVVELKAPKVKIGAKEINQIESYAYAVTEDERFSSLSATWNFWVISNELDKHAKRTANQDGRERGIIVQTTENGVKVTVWAKEWSQIIQENKHRLKFIQDKLDYSIDRQEGIKHLREAYAEFTKGMVVDEPESCNIA